MNDTFLVSAVILILLAGFFIGLVWWKSRARGLSASQKEQVWKHWHKVLAIGDPHRRIMEGDKVVDYAMSLHGYRGSFADKLKKAGPRFSDVQKLWDAHKMRNHLAHEVNASATEKDAARCMAAFEKALRDLC